MNSLPAVKWFRLFFVFLSLSLGLILSLSLGLSLDLSLLPVFVSECSAQPAKGEVIATLNGEPIYLSEIEENAAFQVYRLRGSIHELLKKEAEGLANRKLLAAEAKKRGISVEALLKKEIDEKVPPLEEKKVDEYIAQHPELTGKGPEGRNRVRTYLSQQALIQRKLDFYASLRGRADFQFLLHPPERPRIQVKTDGRPWRGSPEAPVTLVHFASYSCPLCPESAEKIRRILADFPGKVKWVHRNLFTIQDEKALLAAEVGEAAFEQGRFWEFHERMFSFKGKFEGQKITQTADDIGLNKKDFAEGPKKGRYLLKVKEDLGYAARIGVQGAPVIFVNGLYFSGTFSYEELKGLVQKELERSASLEKRK